MTLILFSLERVIAHMPLAIVVVSLVGYIGGPFLFQVIPSTLSRAIVYGTIGGGTTLWDYAFYERSATEFAQAPLWVVVVFTAHAVGIWFLIAFGMLRIRSKYKSRA